MSELRVVATGLCFPEGRWPCADGSVVLVEIERQTVSRVLPDGTVQVIARTGGGPNGAGPGTRRRVLRLQQRRLRLAAEDEPAAAPRCSASDYASGRIQRVDPTSGAVSVLYDRCGANKLNGPNDIVFDAHGGFYFTDLGKTRARDRDHGVIYYALADGSKIVEVASPALTPNGIGLSPDGSVLYVAETEPARLWAFDITEPGVVEAGLAVAAWRPAGHRPAGLPALRQPGSGGGGQICVATLITGCISVIAPDGRLVRQVPMPDPVTTNICFGGPDLRTAYVTLSGTGQLVAMDWPEPGLRLACEA